MEYLHEKFGLEGKIAVITGGGGAICGAIAEGFLKAGAAVVLWGIRRQTLETKKKELTAAGCDPGKIFLVEADLTREGITQKALELTLKEVGQIDILVNGVGGSSKRKAFTEIGIDDFKQIMDLNLLAGCILPSQKIGAYWKENSVKGAIINIASMASYVPLSGAWAYSAAKASVVNLTMGMAKEFAPEGIRVNAIAPGFFLGKQNRALLVNDDNTPTERGLAVLAHTPMNKFGKPEDIAAAAIFLASEGSSFISGITLPVDGAYLCHNI